MSIDDLYADLGVGFQPNDREMFLREFADAARAYKTSLGPKEKDEARNRQLEELAAELGKEVAEFSPRLSLVRLNRKLFTKLNLETPPYIAHLLGRFHFFLVDFPITLLPRSGWGFERLECRIRFNPGRPPSDCPVVYQIFPDEEWQDVIHACQGLAVGLDERFEFKVDSAQVLDELPGLSAPTRASLELKIAGKAGLVLGPFNYYVRRPKIRSQGRGNVNIIWRLDGEDQITQKEPRLGAVLQVPKEVSRVDAIGALAVFRTFHLFSAELRDVLKYVSERARSFFERGAPVADKKAWNDITAGI